MRTDLSEPGIDTTHHSFIRLQRTHPGRSLR